MIRLKHFWNTLDAEDKVCILTLLLLTVGLLWYATVQPEDDGKRIVMEEEQEERQEKEEHSNWHFLILAIMETESRLDSLAVSRDSLDWGILQIRQIYVDDVNRILGIERFRHEDAFSVEKSLEMFNIIQAHYNPARDVDLALKLHNPRGGMGYSEKVKRRYDQLVKMNEIYHQIKQ